jgi:signal transduction histidine kinase
MSRAARSLRLRLLLDLSFLTSAAVLLAGITTLEIVLAGADVRSSAWALGALWLGSTAVFAAYGAHLVRRHVLRPLERLAAEADTLAAGDLAAPAAAYETDELSELAARYRAMAESLLDLHAHALRVEKLAGVGQLAAGVAHEVRNPLGALSTDVEVLRRRGTDPEVMARMRHAIDRIDRTVQSLLDYARPGSRHVADAVDPGAAARTALDFLCAQGALREHDVTVRIADRLPPVSGSRHELEQVVVNLVLNACDAAPGGRIAVGVEPQCYDRTADYRRSDAAAEAPTRRRWSRRPRRPDLEPGRPGVLLYVADSGPGVPPAERERIFDPFYTTKEPGKGAGLGLALVASTVHEAGGLVWVDDAREGGAVFRVFLPSVGAGECES